jgi:outer membrane lipoprotein-sorting protein
MRRIGIRLPFHSSFVFLVALLVPFLAVNSGAARRVELTDGRDILEKCFGTYFRMTSYYGRANTDSFLLDTNHRTVEQLGSSVEVKYKRPNKLLLKFITPVGSRIVWSDSTNLGIYDPSTNKYSLAPTAPNLELMLPLLFQRASVSATFDPLYALSRRMIPAQLTNIVLKEKSTYNGHPVYVVTGILTGRKTINWTWCIDRNSLLLYKIEQDSPPFEQQYTYKQNGQLKHGQRMVNISIRSIVADARPNAPIADSDFGFKLPSGASERIKPSNASDKR